MRQSPYRLLGDEAPEPLVIGVGERGGVAGHRDDILQYAVTRSTLKREGIRSRYRYDRVMVNAHVDISQGLDGEPVVLACFDLGEEQLAASAYAVAATAEHFRNSELSTDDVIELRELTAFPTSWPTWRCVPGCAPSCSARRA